MMRRLGMICLFLGAVLCGGTAAAQHTLGVTGGYGYGNARFYPDQETRAVWGCYTAGVTWRYYGPQRFVGGFGIDFEYLQRGFSFLQNPTEEDPAKYQWYTRRVKSLMLPIVWQPHIYLFKNRMRVYLDAAVFFSYNISSTFINKVRRYLRSSPKVLGGENMISKWSATTGGGTVWRAAAVSPYW